MQELSRRLLASGSLLGALGVPAPFAQQTVAPLPLARQTALQLAPFNSIEVRNGGHVVLRPASTQRVNMLRGSLDYTRVAVTDRGRLVIDKCTRKCPRGYELEVEIFTPNIAGISIANGGRVQARGGFSRQADLAVAASHGGMIDVRSMAADRVTATVNQGGGIFTAPRAWLFARVTQGGVITYWGDAQVRSSIEHGGAVNRGSADQIDAPLSEVGLSASSHAKPR